MSQYRLRNPAIVAEFREPMRVKVLKALSWLPSVFVLMGLCAGVASGAALIGALALPMGVYGGIAILRYQVRRGHVVQG